MGRRSDAIRYGSIRSIFIHFRNHLDVAQRGRLHNFFATLAGGGLVEEPQHAAIGGADTPGWVRAGAAVRLGAQGG